QLTQAGLSCCLNASTLTETLLTQLKQQVDHFHKIVYCHNYYPRPNTGLSQSFVQAQNTLIRHYNPEAMIYGFISGTKKRGP
ncbi:MupG family TIM beta-alpha barrel fold protein, partial [Staphylococcus hominis]